MTDNPSPQPAPASGNEAPAPAGKRDVFYDSEDGLRLYAAEYGPADAPLTVLCMHGLTRNHKDFEPMIARLDLPYRFISVDVRGRGQSDRDPNRKYSPDVYARDMIALLDKLGIQKAVLIGTSMGGLMAMIMSRMAKEQIAGIVLNDVGPAVDAAGLQRIAGYTSGMRSFPDWQSAAAAISDTQKALFPEYTAEDWMDFTRRTCREAPDGTVKFDYDPAITENMGAAIPGWRTRIIMWRLFGGMKKFPLLVTRGEKSDILSAETANRMCRRHKNARLATIPNRGHAPMLSEPEAVLAISDFLTSLSGAGETPHQAVQDA